MREAEAASLQAARGAATFQALQGLVGIAYARFDPLLPDEGPHLARRRLWLNLDPDTLRSIVSNRDPTRIDRPPGPQAGPRRQGHGAASAGARLVKREAGRREVLAELEGRQDTKESKEPQDAAHSMLSDAE